MLSVERYTADYGWLGYMMALEEKGLHTNSEKSAIMRASDISSVKEYSVTYAGYSENDTYQKTFDDVQKPSELKETLCEITFRNRLAIRVRFCLAWQFLVLFVLRASFHVPINSTSKPTEIQTYFLECV